MNDQQNCAKRKYCRNRATAIQATWERIQVNAGIIVIFIIDKDRVPPDGTSISQYCN